MVKATKQQTEKALRALSPNIRGVLLYGPDEGLGREYADAIGRQIVEDLADPFRVARLGPDMVKATGSILADEMAALSMVGGRRLIRLDGASDAMVPALEDAFLHAGDSLLLAMAGDLGKGSKLRKLFEGDDHLLAIACYADEGRDLVDLLRRAFQDARLDPSPDALAWLAAHLGNDRMVTRSEIEKLILYKGDDPDRTISMDDVRASVGDAAALTLAEIAQAVTGGEAAALDYLLEKAWISGESAIAVLRVLQARLMRLHLVRGHMNKGLSASEAAGRLAPPLFFKERDGYLRDVGRWPPDRLAAALDLILETEIQCKSTGMPAETLTARLCLKLALSVRGRR
jgi:DNA polymerase-3 subunit delta